jgi:hypothetical protein
MKESRHSIISRIVAVFCLITILITSCTGAFSVDKVKANSLEYINADYSGDNMHKVSEDTYTSVCSSGLIELLFDEKTATVAIRDNHTKKIWNTLPSNNITKQIDASAVEIVLSNGDGKIYTLNSQDNSVSFGNFTYTLGVDEVTVKYESQSRALSFRVWDENEQMIKDVIFTIYYTTNGNEQPRGTTLLHSVSESDNFYYELTDFGRVFGVTEEGIKSSFIFI